MLFCVKNLKERSGNTAGAKAPADIVAISSEQLGAKEIVFYDAKQYSSFLLTRFFAMFTGLQNWSRIEKNAKPGDIVILQHPYENLKVANYKIKKLKKKNIHFINIIHDLNSIRYTIDPHYQLQRHVYADEVVLKDCDVIICHNEAMKNHLIQQGFDSEKLVVLGIFDYLHQSPLMDARSRSKQIIVAGNLKKGKCEYLYKLIEQPSLPFDLELFGPGFMEKENPNIHYHGVCTPEELPSRLEGSFGLVWDGAEIDRCGGNFGEYIMYNNPHKCSLFLASNLPVIIWEKAALAPLIKEKGLGLLVGSLNDIGTAIDQLSDQDYQNMVEHVVEYGKLLRSGWFFSEACKKAIQLIVNGQ